MIKIEQLIVEQGLIKNDLIKERRTVRAIIINENQQVLMTYSNYFADYTFAGGGVKKHESERAALKRELKEELGAISLDIIKPCFSIKELRYGIEESDEQFLQTSIYYLCNTPLLGKQELIGREIVHAIEPKWVGIEDAIKQNNKAMKDVKHQKKGLKTVLVRENIILNKIKGSNLCENLK